MPVFLPGGPGGGAANLTLTGDATTVSINVDTGTDVVIPAATATTAGVATAAQITKLNGIATAATANATDAQLRDRTTHTGAQAISTVTGLQAALDAKQATLVSATNIKTVNGNSLLGSGDIAIAGAAANLTLTGDATTVSINVDTGTDVVIPAATATAAGVATAAQITKLNGIATAATANATDAQLRDRTTHTGAQAISTVTGLQAALDTKQATLVSATNIKTVNGNSLLGSGDIAIAGAAANLTLTGDATTVSINVDTGTDVVIPAATATAAGVATAAQITKLNGIATAATANATDAQLRDRTTHTGAQAISTVTGLQAALDTKQATLVSATNIKTVNGNSLLGSGDIAVAGSSVSYAKVRFVSTTGDDGTAVLGDMTKPYASVRSAVDACAAGEVVMLLPGTHTGVAPLVLKNGCTLTSFMGKSFTKLVFPGTFPIQGGSSVTTHGGHIQPSAGVQGVDACYVGGLHLELQVDAVGTYAALTGVNTATGTAIVGTGATYADMYLSNCSCIGLSDVHFIIDARQRTYFKDCYIESAFDWCHLIGPNNIASCEFDSCKLVWRPWYDNTNFIGPALGGWWRVRSGELVLRGCSVEIWNDGRTNWVTYNIGAGDQVGGVVDDFAGATVRVLGGLPIRYLGAAWPIPIIPRFSSTGAATGVSAGAVIVDQAVEGLCDYNADTGGNVMSRAVRIVPLNDLTLRATVFAGATTGKRNNTYKCDAAAVSQTFPMFTLPPNTVVKRAWVGVKTAFSGGAGTATTIEVGTSATSTKYLAATNVRAAALTVGSNVMLPEASGDTLTGTGTLVQLIVRNTGANVATLTAGEVDVFVELAGTAL